MRKKYLSALLFGALLFASAGTFTSCKDYDDDINNLQSQITDVKNAIAELQSAIDNGKYVSDVVAEGTGLKVTWNDGSTTTISNVINEETGSSSSVITIDTTTGEVLMNGEGTGFFLSKGATKAPYVNDNGVLVLIDENGKEVETGIRVAPVTAVKNTDGSYTLTIIAADGTKQEILIPSFASSITGIELLKDDQPATIDKNLNIKYWVVKDGTANWKGPRGNIPAKSVLYSAVDGQADIDFKLNPANIDGTEVAFALVNSNDGFAPVKLTTPENNKTLISRATTYNNGMYQTCVGERSEIFAYSTNANDFTSQLVDGNDHILFALTPDVEGLNVRSAYQIGFELKANPTIDLGQIIINGVNEDAADKEYKLTIGGNTGNAVIKVDKTASLSVENPSDLYDMYMTVTDAAKDKFGLVIDNEARTITATKSPDDLTDATFDLTVYVMDNTGKIYDATVVKVTVNRTMAASTYEKQTKELTKLDYAFSVPATTLFNSLGTTLNAWKESVDLSKTTFELLQKNSAGNYETATENVTNFKTSGSIATAIDPNNVANAGVAFVTSDNKIATSANLDNIRFTLAVQQAAANKPIKIGKDYYIRLTFKTSESVTLNSIIVPFELTKPELSAILVKESGVFRDGDDLAYAYMYWKDADTYDATKATVDLTKVAKSQYYIDRAFTDMVDKLSKAGMDAKAFTVSTTDKLVNNQSSSAYASVDDNSTRRYIELTAKDSNGNYIGYKQDLNVIFSDNYLGVNDDSYKYEHTYKFRIMSPILEGEAIAANNLVEVSATGRTKLYKEDIWAKTYNNDVKYDIFRKSDNEWYRDDIKDVTFSTANKNVFEVTVANPTDPKPASGSTAAVPSYIEVEGVSENTSKLNVEVEDIWGYTLKDQVDIKTTLNLGE